MQWRLAVLAFVFIIAASAMSCRTAADLADAPSPLGAAPPTDAASLAGETDVVPRGSAVSPGAGPSGGLPPIALLLHNDADVRIRTLRTLAELGDTDVLDDLIRAYSVEFYTPVNNAYAEVLRGFTSETGKGQAKAWLAKEVAAGRLKARYEPVDLEVLDEGERTSVQPFAARVGPEHFGEMAAALKAGNLGFLGEHLRYMVFNDHREEVRSYLCGDWLREVLSHELKGGDINILAYHFDGLADPGPLRDNVNAQVSACLDDDDETLVANALHLLAGVEGYSTVFVVPEAADKVRTLTKIPVPAVAERAAGAMTRLNRFRPAAQVTYEEAFVDLYETLGRAYPCFALKGIDWNAVGEELLPRAGKVKTDEEFGLLCMELVARLEDSHAGVLEGALKPPSVPLPRWDPGFACLIDDRERPVVYHVDRNGPAYGAGVRPGMAVVSMSGQDALEALDECMRRTRRYVGYSSDRYLRYHAAQWIARRMEQGEKLAFILEDTSGATKELALPATIGVRYLSRLPVPIDGIADSGSVSWKMLDESVGYIYVRRIRGDLIERLDRAVGELKDARGLIVDVRGNSGGGFDARRSHRNFAPEDPEETARPRFGGPVAVLIDARCISAGEGWASWFVAEKRARLFGEATAGASSRKTVYTLKNGLYKVRFPVKAYTGFLDRPIERRGLEPDVAVRQNAEDLVRGRDTVLEAAKACLLDAAASAD